MRYASTKKTREVINTYLEATPYHPPVENQQSVISKLTTLHQSPRLHTSLPCQASRGTCKHTPSKVTFHRAETPQNTGKFGTATSHLQNISLFSFCKNMRCKPHYIKGAPAGYRKPDMGTKPAGQKYPRTLQAHCSRALQTSVLGLTHLIHQVNVSSFCEWPPLATCITKQKKQATISKADYWYPWG